MTKKNKIIAKETIDVLERGYTTTKKIHLGYQEFENAKNKDKNFFIKYKMKQYFGKWQYFFKKGDLKISLIEFRDMSTLDKENWFWEICAYEDKRLFEGCQRFPTKEGAMKVVENLLKD